MLPNPFWDQRPDLCYCQTPEGLWMWGSISDERTGLPFVALIVSSTCHIYLQFYLLAFYIVIYQESSGL
jgi:hypothetical protein